MIGGGVLMLALVVVGVASVMIPNQFSISADVIETVNDTNSITTEDSIIDTATTTEDIDTTEDVVTTNTTDSSTTVTSKEQPSFGATDTESDTPDLIEQVGQESNMLVDTV